MRITADAKSFCADGAVLGPCARYSGAAACCLETRETLATLLAERAAVLEELLDVTLDTSSLREITRETAALSLVPDCLNKISSLPLQTGGQLGIRRCCALDCNWVCDLAARNIELAVTLGSGVVVLCTCLVGTICLALMLLGFCCCWYC